MFPRTISVQTARKLKSHLKKGGLVAYPTESCYGLGCMPTLPKALNRLIRLKKRPQHKGMIVVGNNARQLFPLLAMPSEKAEEMLSGKDEVPTSFLLPSEKRVLPLLRGRSRSKLAVRVPQHKGARQLCNALGTPLVSTSCNRAGKRPCKTEREARRQFGRQVWIVGGKTGGKKTPSRIIDGETGKRLR